MEYIQSQVNISAQLYPRINLLLPNPTFIKDRSFIIISLLIG